MSAKIGKKIYETITKIKAYQSTRVKHPVPGTKVSVTDTISHETTIYESIRRAAAALDTNHNTIRNYLKNNKLYKDRYSLLTFKTFSYIFHMYNRMCEGLIFNGNMVFPTRNARLLTFLSSFTFGLPFARRYAPKGRHEKLIKSKVGMIVPVVHTCVLPTLKDGWISGITDGAGRLFYL